MAEPAEIGSVVAFLAGGGASYITATTIFADGGIMQSSPGSEREPDDPWAGAPHPTSGSRPSTAFDLPGRAGPTTAVIHGSWFSGDGAQALFAQPTTTTPGTRPPAGRILGSWAEGWSVRPVPQPLLTFSAG